MAIHNDLIEAYVGTYEDTYEVRAGWSEENPPSTEVHEDIDAFTRRWCEKKIKSDTPRERLEVYLNWNGILGYGNRIWEIAQGSFED